MLVTLTLSEPHEIRKIENSVEEKVGKEKIAESDINFWLPSLHPLSFLKLLSRTPSPFVKDVLFEWSR